MKIGNTGSFMFRAPFSGRMQSLRLIPCPSIHARNSKLSTTTQSVTVNPQPTTEELKAYRNELKEWRAANNMASGVILGSISNEVRHVIVLGDSAKEMYDKLRAEVVSPRTPRRWRTSNNTLPSTTRRMPPSSLPDQVSPTRSLVSPAAFVQLSRGPGLGTDLLEHLHV